MWEYTERYFITLGEEKISQGNSKSTNHKGKEWYIGLYWNHASKSIRTDND